MGEEAAMSIVRSDPLLRGTRFLLRITQGIALIAGVGLIIAIPSIWAFSDRVIAAAASEGHKMFGYESLAAITVILIGALTFVGLAFQFLRKLIALIGSLEHGSPFVPENAARLRYMGWLVLAMQGLALLAVPLIVWIKQALPDSHVVFGFSIEGLITALLLFILARVFDHGTRLTEDVEGTV
jgi:Protein of unknown function (DUF2975)